MTRSLFLSDPAIKRLAFAKDKPYRVRDSELDGFFLDVGRDYKTLRQQLSVKGETKGASWAWPEHTADEARTEAQERRRRRDRGEPLDGTVDAMTLQQAWESYEALLKKKGRSENTIDGYRDVVERCLADLKATALVNITRKDATDLHKKITDAGHPYMANQVARVAHAIYAHAAKDLEVPLPALNPFRGRNLHNKEKAREVDFDEQDLGPWFKRLTTISNPIWREWYWMCVLTGLRRETISEMRIEHVNFDKSYIEIPNPKGGTDRAFRVPMSKPMRGSLQRALRAGESVRERFPHCAPWVFPSPKAKGGHVAEPKIQKEILGTGPHDLRHVNITFAPAAGVMTEHAHVLANHKVPANVHARYMSVPAMFGALSTAQEALSAFILQHVGKGAEATLERLLKRDLTPQAEAA